MRWSNLPQPPCHGCAHHPYALPPWSYDHDDYKANEEVHEDDEHIHDIVVVEDCST